MLTWNRVAWAAIYGLAVFEFMQVLQNPATHMVADPLPPAFSTIALFLAIRLVSVLFWAYFRFRPLSRPRAGGRSHPALATTTAGAVSGDRP